MNDMWSICRPDAIAVLKDPKARRSLNRYFAVMEDSNPANFMIAKRIQADYSETDSTTELWRIHDRLTGEFNGIQEEIDTRQKNLDEMRFPTKSYLDLKVEIARRILQECHFCTRRCRVNRLAGELGYCKCGTQVLVSTMFHHMGEEPELVPSGTIFTLGCTLCCLHCQNWTISQWYEKGTIYSPEQLGKEVERLRRSGCRNVNLVGGEPTPWLQQWLETFQHVNVNVPVVWNSNSYYSSETARLLAGFADVYLLDFKYGPDRCATRISNAPDYWEVCTRNHIGAKKSGELIIRLLILPGHLECCTTPIISWIAGNLGVSVRANIMFQYRPEWRAKELSELRRRLTKNEIEKAITLAKQAELANFIT